MKTAVSHTGQILNFPDQTPDEAIDQHMQGLAQESEQQENQRVEAEQKDKMAKAGDLHYTAVTQEHAADRKQRDLHHDHKMTVAVAGHAQKSQSDNIRNAHLQNFGVQLAQLNQSLQHVVAIAPMLQALVGAVVGLTDEIKASAAQLAKGQAAPKSLTFDARGRPIGIKSHIDSEPPPQETVMPPAGNA